MQKFQPLTQESLNIGTGMTWVTSPGRGRLRSTQIGIHTFARGQQAYEATWTPGAITAGSKVSTTVTVPDASAGDVVKASHSKMLTNDLRITGHVSASGIATVVLHNPTAASVTIPEGTLRVLLFPFPDSIASYDDLEASFVIDVNGAGATGGSGAESSGWTGNSTVTGGSGSYLYSWVVWNENSSQLEPLYTSSVADPNFAAPVEATCVGQAVLVVTDAVTALQVEVGPEAWDWNCI